MERASRQIEDVKSAAALTALVNNLASEIGDPVKIQRFKDQIWKKVGGG